MHDNLSQGSANKWQVCPELERVFLDDDGMQRHDCLRGQGGFAAPTAAQGASASR